MLSVLYDMGARVQEMIDMTAGDIRLEEPAQVRISGKGRRVRVGILYISPISVQLNKMRPANPQQAQQPVSTLADNTLYCYGFR